MGLFDWVGDLFERDSKPAPAQKFASASKPTASPLLIAQNKTAEPKAAKGGGKEPAAPATAAPELQKKAEKWMPTPSARRALDQYDLLLPEDKLAAAPPPPKGATQLTPYEQKFDATEFDRINVLYGKNRKGPRPSVPPLSEAVVSTQMHEKQLTDAEYNKLSQEQRAAIDFNTLLVAAREKDLKDEIKLDGEALSQYEKDVADIFGAVDTSTRVAPATVKLLKDIKYSSPGQDLDSFLSLEAAIDTEELKNFKLPPLPQIKAYEQGMGGEPLSQERLLSQLNLAPDRDGGTWSDQGRQEYGKINSASNVNTSIGLAVRNSQNFINTLMKNPDLPTFNVRDRFAAFNDPNAMLSTPGWGSTPLDEQFKSLYQQVSAKDFSDPTLLWNELDELNYTPEEKDQLVTYFWERSRYEDNLGGVGTNQRSGAEMRKFLSLED